MMEEAVAEPAAKVGAEVKEATKEGDGERGVTSLVPKSSSE